MGKRVIGKKFKANILMVLAMFLMGVALVGGAIAIYLYVIGGAIGGGIAGGMGALGVMLCMMAFGPRSMPNDLVLIDDTHLYLHKRAIALDQIVGVKGDRFTIIVMLKEDKPVKQSYLKNGKECREHIRQALERLYNVQSVI